MTRRIITLLYLIIITPNIIIAQNKIAKDILDQLSEKGQTYEDITAEFEGSFSNNNQGIYEDISGKIWIKGDMYKLDLYEEDLAIINNEAENSDVKFLIQQFDYPPEDWMFYIGLNDLIFFR